MKLTEAPPETQSIRMSARDSRWVWETVWSWRMVKVFVREAGLETCDTAGSEACATGWDVGAFFGFIGGRGVRWR